MAVAVAHWTQPHFQDGWPDLTRPAVVAVGGFFVLSGYTIRLLTPGDQEFSAAAFCIERLSRLWSVALPALALTMILDGLSYLVNPQFYSAGWGPQATHPVARVLVSCLFANEIWGHDVSPFSNSLFWSLSYEAGFYFLYGVYRATRGLARYLLVGLGAVLIGPNILLMSIPWLGGVLLFDVCSRLQYKSRQATVSLIGVCVCGLVLVPTAVFTLLNPVALSDSVTNLAASAFNFADRQAGHFLVGIHFGLGRIHGDLILGAAFFWLLFLFGFPLAKALDGLWDPSRVLVKIARRLGEATFPLYLLHFPIFVLLGALSFYDRHSVLQKCLLFVAVCAAIFLVAPLTEPVKRLLRAGLRSLLAGGMERWQRGSPGRS
jgi:peptidoglycan/LPS O-acetylase OafA/YrhL